MSKHLSWKPTELVARLKKKSYRIWWNESSERWVWLEADWRRGDVIDDSVPSGHCKRLSDAKRRCQKRAGRKLNWGVKTWDYVSGGIRTQVTEAGSLGVKGEGRPTWAWSVLIPFHHVRWGRETVQVHGNTKTAALAKEAAEYWIRRLTGE